MVCCRSPVVLVASWWDEVVVMGSMKSVVGVNLRSRVESHALDLYYHTRRTSSTTLGSSSRRELIY